MKYIANIDIGNFKKGQEVPKEQAENWKKAYKYSPVDLVEEELPNVSENKIEERLKDIKADLRDDGKLNYSHDPKRNKPGRKKKSKKK